MPKVKTHSGSKRFRLTKSGKVKRACAYKSHLATGHGKTPKRKRNLLAGRLCRRNKCHRHQAHDSVQVRRIIMARIKNAKSTRARRKKVLGLAKGY